MAIATGGEGWYLTDEEWVLKQNIHELVEKEIAPRFKENFTEETADPYYREVMKLVGEQGFLRLSVDPKLGGYGMRFTASLLAVEEMTRGCGALGIHVLENPLLGAQMAVAALKAWDEVGEGILDGSVIFASSMTSLEGNGIMRHHLDAFGYYIGLGTPDLHIPCAGENLGFPKSDDLNRV